MKSVSISRVKTWKTCRLLYRYTYVDKFVPKDKKPILVTVKGLALHETFEELLKFENYKNDKPELPYRQASTDEANAILNKYIESNKIPESEAKEFRLDLGLKRWLNFKHNYLDKNGHIMYSEKQYNEVLFGETKTITILDLLEDCGDGNFVIYDYKTPKSADVSRYKEQLVLYAYTMACVKGIITPGSEEFEKVADHFKLKVFFPLIDGDSEDFNDCLKDVKFTAEDVKNVVMDIKNACDEIDAFDFNKPAEVLQPSKLIFQCRWCDFCGSKPQMDIHSENGNPFYGCPISVFAGQKALNESFVPVVKGNI